MKKFVKLLALSVMLLSLTGSAFAGLWMEQHYDFARTGFLTTFAYAGTDKTGGWFGFVDLRTSLDSRAFPGAEDADPIFDFDGTYFEIMRDFNFGKIFKQDGFMKKMNLHLEINDSTASGRDLYGLAGLKFNIIDSFKKNDNACPTIVSWNVSASWLISRKDAGSSKNGVQFTTDWFIMFPLGPVKTVFTGFVDVWMKKDNSPEWGFLGQPQLKFYLPGAMKDFAIGTEVEISSKSYFENGTDDLVVRPTIFVSYDF